MANLTETLVGAPAGNVFNASVDHFSRFLGLSVGNLYLLAAACTLWEVISRYVFNSPTQWVFEVVMVLCACAWMLSAGFVTLQKRHIGITVLYLMAPDRIRWWQLARGDKPPYIGIAGRVHIDRKGRKRRYQGRPEVCFLNGIVLLGVPRLFLPAEITWVPSDFH